MKRALSVLAVLALSSVLPMWGQEKPFPISVQGSYEWTFALGIGDTGVLRREGLQPWVPSMKQGIAAEITGKVTDAISIKARIDSRKPVAFQDFGVYLDSGNWKGVLGNFSLGDDFSFAIPPRSLLGAKLAYLGDGFTVEGVASRSLGKIEVRIFKGERGEAEAVFSLRDPRAPWKEASYLRDLRGLFYFELAEPYVEGLTEVRLRLTPGDDLWELLGTYGLGYLREVLEEGAERETKFTVVTDRGKDVLLLREAPLDAAKRLIEDSIRDYNERHGLTGREEKRYPFVPGSSVEREFLEGLVGFIELAVNDEGYPLVDAPRGGYLFLGQGDVIPEGFELSVRLPDETDFVPLPEGFTYRLFPEEGVIWIGFPEWFLADEASLRARFQYRTKRDIFFLSPFGIVRGSEKVRRNGKPMKRGQDYSIDYETGTLQLFTPLKEGEELRVEFEVPHGLGTGPQEDLLGISLSLGEGARLFLFRSAEVMEITPTTPTMPNEHTVAGVLLSGKGKGWSYSLVLGGSVNVFPPGKNERIPGPNRVTAIGTAAAPDGIYTVFSHLRGISVYRDGAFYSYRSGRRIYDLLSSEGFLLLAERGALVLVDLSRPSPFDWRESYTELLLKGAGISGLGKEVLALGADGEWIYVATERGVIRFPRGDLSGLPELLSEPGRRDEWLREHWVLWTRFPPEAGRPTSLAAFSGKAYVGTEHGLWECDDGSCARVGIEGRVYDLLYPEESPQELPQGLYVASSEGLFVFDGNSLEPLDEGPEVTSLLVHDGELFYGTGRGLFRYGEDGAVFEPGAPITALGTEGEAIWIGTEATPLDGKPTKISLYKIIPDTGDIEEFPEELNRILPTDPDTFRDIPREGNTDQGAMARFSWSEEMEDGRIGWHIRINTPGYEPIDRPPPGEGHGIGFSLSKRYGPLSLGLQGDLGIRSFVSRPVSDVSGRVSLGWEGGEGTGIDLSLSPFLRGLGTGSRTSGLGYSLGFTWRRPEDFEDRGLLQALGLNTKGGLKAGGSGGTIEVTAALGPFGPFELELQGRRPYLLRGPVRGEEAWGVTLSGATALAGVGIKVRWEESWRRAMGPHVEEGWRYARSLSLVPELEPWSLGDWVVRPGFTLSGRQDAAETRLSLKGSPSLEVPGEPSLRLSLETELGYRWIHRTGDTVWSLRLSPKFTLASTDLGSLELSARSLWELILRGDGKAASRFSLDRIALTLTPRLLGWRPRFVLEYSPGRVSLSLERTELSWGGFSFSLMGKLSWDLGRGGLEGEVKVMDITYELSGDWNISLEAGYLFGLGRRGFRQGIYGKGNLALDFSF